MEGAVLRSDNFRSIGTKKSGISDSHRFCPKLLRASTLAA